MIPVFFNPNLSSTKANSYSPSAAKPALAVADWLANQDIAKHIEVVDFEPVSRDVLYAVHDKAYVDGVLDCEIENGFGNFSQHVAATLPYTVGSMVAAAKHVTSQRTKRFQVAVSPTSGFHHANYSHGGGFCTFNGLMAAAVEAKRLGLAKNILILDGDGHHGDGTDNIIKKLGIDYVTNITSGKSYNTSYDLLGLFRSLIMDQPEGYWDLVLFQAGADAWNEDPLGAGLLSFNELRLRDLAVFESCIMRGAPLVWNLAGGYSKDSAGTIEPVLAIHRQTMQECVRFFK